MPAHATGGIDLRLEGVIYHHDGRTPAEGIILYAYHTDNTGLYPKHGTETGWGRRHGQLRGWVRTGPDGRYGFMTTLPAPYPDLTEPAHIHLTVKEPGLIPYYIDDVVFEQDTLVNTAYRAKQVDRGGNGIVSLHTVDGMLTCDRDIVLGWNIPEYPLEGPK
ncbi:MAG: intradiol ring-cleavage dioxygenase [Flavobacteriales bacterium]|nr:intradiol ring-cleavage dioxygenase [Flavobacteriales bacterium]